MFARILALIIKELTSLWSDKKTRYVLIFPPLIQVIVFAQVREQPFHRPGKLFDHVNALNRHALLLG